MEMIVVIIMMMINSQFTSVIFAYIILKIVYF